MTCLPKLIYIRVKIAIGWGGACFNLHIWCWNGRLHSTCLGPEWTRPICFASGRKLKKGGPCMTKPPNVEPGRAFMSQFNFTKFNVLCSAQSYFFKKLWPSPTHNPQPTTSCSCMVVLFTFSFLIVHFSCWTVPCNGTDRSKAIFIYKQLNKINNELCVLLDVYQSLTQEQMNNYNSIDNQSNQ